MNRSAVVALAAGVSITLAACGNAKTSPKSAANGSAVSRVQVHGSELRYGSDIGHVPGSQYESDVVVIDHGAQAVRGASGDGLVWTMDPSAPGVSHLAVGKIMMATGLAVGRVEGLRRTAAGMQVALGPVTLTDVFRRLHLHGTRVPLTNPLYYSIPAFPAASSDVASEPLTADAVSVRRLGTPIVPIPTPSLPTPSLPTPPVPIPDVTLPPPVSDPGVLSVGNAEVAPRLDTSGLTVHVRYHHGEGAYDAKLTLEMDAPSADFTLDIDDGEVREASVTLHGAAGIKLSLNAAQLDDSGQFPDHLISVPLDLKVPLGYGFYLSVSQHVRLASALIGRASLMAFGSYGIKGELRFGVRDGHPLLAGAFLTVADPLNHHVTMVGAAGGGLSVGWRVTAEIGIGLGILSLGAWYKFGFNTELAAAASTDVLHPGCVKNTVYLRGQFGIGYHVLPIVMKAVNLVLSIFGAPEIPADGGLMSKYLPLGPVRTADYCNQGKS